MKQSELTKTVKAGKEVWFCGCEMDISTVLSEDDWIAVYWHKKVWNKKLLRYEYICHENKIVKIINYETI